MNVQTLFDEYKRLDEYSKKTLRSLIGNENQTHEEVFGHLNGAEFHVHEAMDYLNVSEATFRRIIKSGALKASTSIGRSNLYLLDDLKSVKKARKAK